MHPFAAQNYQKWPGIYFNTLFFLSHSLFIKSTENPNHDHLAKLTLAVQLCADPESWRKDTGWESHNPKPLMPKLLTIMTQFAALLQSTDRSNDLKGISLLISIAWEQPLLIWLYHGERPRKSVQVPGAARTQAAAAPCTEQKARCLEVSCHPALTTDYTFQMGSGHKRRAWPQSGEACSKGELLLMTHLVKGGPVPIPDPPALQRPKPLLMGKGVRG